MISLVNKIITAIKVINTTITFYKRLGYSWHNNVSAIHKF